MPSVKGRTFCYSCGKIRDIRAPANNRLRKHGWVTVSRGVTELEDNRIASFCGSVCLGRWLLGEVDRVADTGATQ